MTRGQPPLAASGGAHRRPPLPRARSPNGRSCRWRQGRSRGRFCRRLGQAWRQGQLRRRRARECCPPPSRWGVVLPDPLASRDRLCRPWSWNARHGFRCQSTTRRSSATAPHALDGVDDLLTDTCPKPSTTIDPSRGQHIHVHARAKRDGQSPAADHLHPQVRR